MVQVFIDPNPKMAGRHADLFREYGLEAYGILFARQQQ